MQRASVNIRWLLFALLFLISPVTAYAQSSSSSYQVEEFFFGSGGTNDSSSTSFNARGSIGDLGIGNSSSANFQLWAGYTTTDVPYLEFVVPAATVDLGVLDTSSTASGSAGFYIRTYLASGYVVQTASDPPVNGSYTIPNMAAAAAPTPGTEEFGINLVANTVPDTVGANPAQIPDGSFGFGYAATGYDTTNVYKYVKGDVLSRSDSSSGRTDYTITYVMNIDQNTPGGVYTMDHVLVATSTF